MEMWEMKPDQQKYLHPFYMQQNYKKGKSHNLQLQICCEFTVFHRKNISKLFLPHIWKQSNLHKQTLAA